VILVTFTLAFEHLHDLRQQFDRDLIEYIYELQEMLDQTEQENRELQEQNKDLQDRWARHVQARERMQVYALAFRGGRPDAIAMPITQPSGFTAADFERSFSGTGLEGIGEALTQAEAEHGINALVLAAIIVHETGWGRSRLAREKNNLAGLGAYDGQEYSAGISFDSRAASIMFLAELLAVKYAPGGKYYGGSHDLRGIGVKYASDSGWAAKVAGAMRLIARRVAS